MTLSASRRTPQHFSSQFLHQGLSPAIRCRRASRSFPRVARIERPTPSTSLRSMSKPMSSITKTNRL